MTPHFAAFSFSDERPLLAESGQFNRT